MPPQRSGSENTIRNVSEKFPAPPLLLGEVLLLAVGAFLLTVELLCLQSLKALLRRTLPL